MGQWGLSDALSALQGPAQQRCDVTVYVDNTPEH